LANAAIDRCLQLVRFRAPSPRDVVDLLKTMTTACAAAAEYSDHRRMIADTAARMAYAVPNETTMFQQLLAINGVLNCRDSKMIAHLARAMAIVEASERRL